MARLPLQIRKDIRDDWDNEASPVQHSRKELTAVLGVENEIRLNWEHLWQLLEKDFPHGQGLVPTIATIIKAWFDELVKRLNHHDYSEWADQFLNEISGGSGGGGSLINVEVITWSSNKPKTEWKASRAVFIISIPENNLSSVNELAARQAFSLGFEHLFQARSSSSTLPADPDWDDIGASTGANEVPIRTSPVQQTQGPLPAFTSIARPEHLYNTALPYWLLVRFSGSTLVVQGSHSPSLELIAEYFTKWSKQLPNDSENQPILRIRLKDSFFGLGAHYDALEIEPYRQNDYQHLPNPVLVLTFIESILGYAVVFQDRDSWHFKRERAFSSV